MFVYPQIKSTDENRDGRVSEEEFLRLCSGQLGICSDDPTTRNTALFNLFVQNGSGKLTRSQFIEMLNILEEDKLSDDDKKEIDEVFGTDDSKPITLESKYHTKIKNEAFFKLRIFRGKIMGSFLYFLG